MIKLERPEHIDEKRWELMISMAEAIGDGASNLWLAIVCGMREPGVMELEVETAESFPRKAMPFVRLILTASEDGMEELKQMAEERWPGCFEPSGQRTVVGGFDGREPN